MLKVKRTAAFSVLLALALVMAGCVGGLGGPVRLPGVPVGDGSTGPDVLPGVAFPSDDMRDSDLAPHVAGEIIVKVDSEERAYQIAQKLEADVTGFLAPIGLAKLELRDKSRSLTEAMRSLRDEPGVSYAQANFTSFTLPVQEFQVADIALLEEDDPAGDFLTDPESLYNRFQYGPRAIRAPEAWSRGLTGKGIVIAIIDTGIQSDHPFLAGKVLEGYNPEAPELGTEDFEGHGTHVAGIAAGLVHQGLGFTGIAPDALILPIRVFNAEGASNWAVAAGVVIAADPSVVGLTSPKADVANLSLGGSVYSLALQDAINFALDRDVVVVAAMGNTSHQSIRYPAAYQGVIAVGATDAHDDKTEFSTTGAHISVVAPGHRVFSSSNMSGFAWAWGTSQAAPHVAGAVALLKEQFPGASPAEIKDLLERTADFKAGHTQREIGHGRINLARALDDDRESRPRGDIELFVYVGPGMGVPGADVVLWRGDVPIRNVRTGGGWEGMPYSGVSWFMNLEPGDDYSLTIRLDEYTHGMDAFHRVDNITVRAGELTSVRIALDR